MSKMKKRLFLLLLSGGVLASTFFFHSASCIKVPVVFRGPGFCPTVKGKIQDHEYAFLVDTGAYQRFYLINSAFSKVTSKKRVKDTKMQDFKGNVYECPIHEVKDLNIHSIALSNAEIVEQGLDFDENTNIWPSIPKSKKRYSHGTIGLKFFKDFTTLFDFQNSLIILAKSQEELEKSGYFNPKKFISVPFSFEKGIVTISLDTAFGVCKLVLDTGASFCTLRRSYLEADKITNSLSGKSIAKNSKLVIGDCDFGSWSFAVTDFAEKLNIDGVLGVDFFLEHAVYFDFGNQLVYIKKPGNWLTTQWRRGNYYIRQFFYKRVVGMPNVENL